MSPRRSQPHHKSVREKQSTWASSQTAFLPCLEQIALQVSAAVSETKPAVSNIFLKFHEDFFLNADAGVQIVIRDSEPLVSPGGGVRVRKPIDLDISVAGTDSARLLAEGFIFAGRHCSKSWSEEVRAAKTTGT